ncbi:efflux RND transporter periplasmic adaptor subunit [bacterium]|nr:efflux RND transporter periplasmic adaptor subunit [bacterium]MDC0321921.1 efflux RND transporter periplasmic adaptor subunit [Verrucomicrobiales bacterium]
MKLALRIVLPLLIVWGAVSLAQWFIANKPKPRKRPTPVQVTSVEATRIKPESFQVHLDTRGGVRPRTTTTLIPEVSGRITEISASFREGGFFEKGDMLLKIDPVDYETAIVIQKSAVAEANRVLSEEKARGEQAVENWKRLGKRGIPSDMVKRMPQLAEAEARLKAAEAELEKRQKDLERTEVKAPYAGRLLEQNVDVGQYVTTGTQLGRAFAIDFVEVRLPLSNQQLGFVDLPEAYRGENETIAKQELPEVLFEADMGSTSTTWKGRIVRVDSAIDQMSRQLFVVAQVEDPYGKHSEIAGKQQPLKIGMFVSAKVKGKLLEGVFVLPRAAVRAGGEVIVINSENKIRRQKVEPVWSDRDNVVIPRTDGGLAAGDIVCLTPLAFPANGASVLPTIDGVAPTVETPAGGFPGKGGKGGKGGGKGKGSKADKSGVTQSPAEKTAEKS